jgi:hypothetical protein
MVALGTNVAVPSPLRNSQNDRLNLRRSHGSFVKEKLSCLLPLLHTLVEERAGERRFPIFQVGPS